MLWGNGTARSVPSSGEVAAVDTPTLARVQVPNTLRHRAAPAGFSFIPNFLASTFTFILTLY
jgi:hypothetical protein